MSQAPLTPAQLLEARPTPAVERTTTPVADVRWMLAVVDDAGMDRAAVFIAADAEQFDAFRERLMRAKLRPAKAEQWKRFALDPCKVTAFVRGGALTELCARYRENLPGGFRDRRSRILANPPQAVTPRWMDAALERKPVVALVPLEHFAIDDDQWKGGATSAAVLEEAIRGAADARSFYAGFMDADLGVEP